MRQNESTSNASNVSPSSSNYFLLEDINVNQVPTNLLKMFKTFSTPQKPFDLLTALVYNLCLEMGFVPAGNDEHIACTDAQAHSTCWAFSYVGSIVSTCGSAPAKLIESQQSLPSSSSDRTYRFTLKLLNFSERHCLLVARSIFKGDVACVTFCLDSSNSRSIILPINRYIHLGKSNEFDDDFNGDANMPLIDKLIRNPVKVLKNVKELSERMKSSVILPIRNELMDTVITGYAALKGLPQEVLYMLFDKLDLNTLQTVSQVSLKMRNEVVNYIRSKGRRVYDAERRRVQIVRMLADGQETYQSIRLPYYRPNYPDFAYPDFL